MKKLTMMMAVAGLLVATSCQQKKEQQKAEDVETVTTTEDATTTEVNTPDDTPTASESEVISTEKYAGDGKELVVDYMGDEEGNMSVKIQVDGKTMVLPQKEAWAKGAIYGNDDVEFTNKGQVDEAQLVMDGKTYNLKPTK